MANSRYITKSENFWAAAAVGGVTQWVHIDAGNTGRTIIRRSTKANGGLILCNIVVNTTGSGTATTITDSNRGVIAQIKASASEKDFHYNIPIQGNILIDNSGASDLTVVYITP